MVRRNGDGIGVLDFSRNSIGVRSGGNGISSESIFRELDALGTAMEERMESEEGTSLAETAPRLELQERSSVWSGEMDAEMVSRTSLGKSLERE